MHGTSLAVAVLHFHSTPCHPRPLLNTTMMMIANNEMIFIVLYLQIVWQNLLDQIIVVFWMGNDELSKVV